MASLPPEYVGFNAICWKAIPQITYKLVIHHSSPKPLSHRMIGLFGEPAHDGWKTCPPTVHFVLIKRTSQMFTV